MAEWTADADVCAGFFCGFVKTTKRGRFVSKSAKLADELDEYRTKFLAARANDLEEEQDDGVVHQPLVHLHAASIVPADRVTTRETTAKKSSTWADVVTFAEDIGGEKTGLLLGNGGSSGMMDRSFGLRGLVLAIRALRANGTSNVDEATLQQIEDLIVGTYSIVTYLMNASCGFCLASMREDYAKVLQLWLQLSKRAAIGVIPVTVHALFHFSALIERFGAPMIYAIYWHESAHVAKKEFLLRLSNMVLGQTGSDYLYQLMKKEAREDREKKSASPTDMFTTIVFAADARKLRISAALAQVYSSCKHFYEAAWTLQMTFCRAPKRHCCTRYFTYMATSLLISGHTFAIHVGRVTVAFDD